MSLKVNLSLNTMEERLPPAYVGVGSIVGVIVDSVMPPTDGTDDPTGGGPSGGGSSGGGSTGGGSSGEGGGISIPWFPTP